DKGSVNSAVSRSTLNESARYAAMSSGELSFANVSAKVSAPSSASNFASSIEARRTFRAGFCLVILQPNLSHEAPLPSLHVRVVGRARDLGDEVFLLLGRELRAVEQHGQREMTSVAGER